MRSSFARAVSRALVMPLLVGIMCELGPPREMRACELEV